MRIDFHVALEKVRTGQAEEVYGDPSKPESFRGIRLLDKSTPSKPSFHRPSLETSNSAITHDTTIKNAGYFFDEGPQQKECVRAHDLVESWPEEYDRNAVVISAGKVHGATWVPSLGLA